LGTPLGPKLRFWFRRPQAALYLVAQASRLCIAQAEACGYLSFRRRGPRRYLFKELVGSAHPTSGQAERHEASVAQAF